MANNNFYYPLLYCRNAEIKALSNLPDSIKSSIFPCFLLRPWPNANFLKKTIEKIKGAFGNRWSVLDLDERFPFVEGRISHKEFSLLHEPNEGFKNYYNFLIEHPNFLPSFRKIGFSDELNRVKQISNIKELGRHAFIHINYEVNAIDYTELVSFLHASGINFSVYLDLGWSPEYFTRQAWASSAIAFIAGLNAEIEIIVSGSSFPDTFTGINGYGSIPVKERYVFQNLKRIHNNANLKYGDWGSARPPREPSPMKIIKRLDLPTPNYWEIYREKDSSDGYEELASLAMSNSGWRDDINIWGIDMIRWTSKNLDGAIVSPAIASAVRINIHLFEQAKLEALDVKIQTDEPFLDDF